MEALNESHAQITDPVVSRITSFDQVVAPDMLTRGGKVDPDSPKLKTWLACLKTHNTLEGWEPQHAVYLAHSPKDDMMPYAQAYNLYRMVSGQGTNPNVHMLNVPLPGFIPTCGMLTHLIIAFLLQMAIAFKENPEDMRRLCKQVK